MTAAGAKRSVPTINIHPVMVGTAQARLCPPYNAYNAYNA